jgi:hypothetical protein
MSMQQRFGRQYQANLREYRRQAPRRFVRLIVAMISALLIGALLHVAKNWPPLLFNMLVAGLAFVAGVLLLIKLAGLYRRTYHETRYIVFGQTEPASNSNASNQSDEREVFNAEFVEPEVPGTVRPSVPATSKGNSAAVWITAMALFAVVLCSGCLATPLLFVWATLSAEPPQTAPLAPPAPLPPERPAPFTDVRPAPFMYDTEER